MFPHHATCAARGLRWFTYRCTGGAFAVPSIARTAGPSGCDDLGGLGFGLSCRLQSSLPAAVVIAGLGPGDRVCTAGAAVWLARRSCLDLAGSTRSAPTLGPDYLVGYGGGVDVGCPGFHRIDSRASARAVDALYPGLSFTCFGSLYQVIISPRLALLRRCGQGPDKRRIRSGATGCSSSSRGSRI
jgi:hypothetical protein